MCVKLTKKKIPPAVKAFKGEKKYNNNKHQQKQSEQWRISILCILNIILEKNNFLGSQNWNDRDGWNIFETPFYLVHQMCVLIVAIIFSFSLWSSLSHWSFKLSRQKKLQHNNNDAMMSSWALSKLRDMWRKKKKEFNTNRRERENWCEQ